MREKEHTKKSISILLTILLVGTMFVGLFGATDLYVGEAEAAGGNFGGVFDPTRPFLVTPDETRINNQTWNGKEFSDHYDNIRDQYLAEHVIINSTNISRAIVNESYSFQLDAYGGVGPLTWNVSSGSLPPGLILASDGIISGTPDTVGNYTFTFSVIDSFGTFSTRTFDFYINPALVGHWAFDEEAGSYANDTSGNDNNGTLMNMDIGTCWVEGINGTALEFDGVDDHVMVPDIHDLDGANEMTLSLWICPRSYSEGSVIVSKTDQFILYHYDDTVGIWLNFSLWDVSYHYVNSLDFNQWSLITAVFDNNSISFKGYINGEEVVSWLAGYPLSKSSGDFYIGWLGWEEASLQSYFDGIVDDVNIYNRALNGSEISDYYNRTWADYLVTHIHVTDQDFQHGLKFQPYFTRLEAISGSGSYTWDLAGGSLPLGLTLNADGNISGTPLETGFFEFDVRATDVVHGFYHVRSFSMIVLSDDTSEIGSWSFDAAYPNIGLDVSGNWNNGTLTDMDDEMCRTDGLVRSAVLLDGIDNHITVAHSDSLDLSEGLTLQGWVRYGGYELRVCRIITSKNLICRKAYLLT